MKLFKRTLYILLAVAVVVGVAVAIFVATFDINDYKDRISREVEKRTGRTISFQDDMELDVLPSLAIDMGRVTLSNREGFGDQPMISINSASVRVRLLPLITGDVEFGLVKFDGLVVRLERDARGDTNWGDLTGQSRHEITEEGTSTRLANELILDLAGVEITNAGLVWDDGMTGARHTLSGLNLTTGPISGGQPFDLSLSFGLESSQPEFTAQAALTGQAAVIPGRRALRCTSLSGGVMAQGANVPGESGELSFSLATVDFDFGRGYISIDGLNASAYGVTLTSDSRVEGLSGDSIRVVGDLNVPPFNLRETIAALGSELPALKGAEALTSVGGSTSFSIMSQSVALTNMDLALDKTTVVGNFRVLRLNEIPEYSFLVRLGELNVDDYMPVEQTTRPEDEPAVMPDGPETPDATGPESRLDALRELILDGEIRAEKLVLDGATLTTVICTIKARDGLVRVSPFSADAYGGTVSSGLTMNLLTKRPTSDVILALKKVDVGQALRDVLGHDSVSGIGDLSGAVSFQGETWDDIRRTLNGKASFSIKDGVFPGVDIMGLVARAEARRRKAGSQPVATGTDTEFGQVSGTLVVKNGVVGNRDLDLRAPGLRVGGEGDVDLRDYDVDYVARVKLVPTDEGQGGASGDELYGVVIPLQVHGSLFSPQYYIDPVEYGKIFGEVVKDTVGGVVKGVEKLFKGLTQ